MGPSAYIIAYTEVIVHASMLLEWTLPLPTAECIECIDYILSSLMSILTQQTNILPETQILPVSIIMSSWYHIYYNSTFYVDLQ